MMFGRQRDVERTSAGRLRELLVFALGIDDDDIHAEHERPQDLELRGITFAGTGLRENDGIIILQREAVKKDERRIVTVQAVEDAAVAREIEGDKGEDRRKRRRIQFRIDRKLVRAERQ